MRRVIWAQARNTKRPRFARSPQALYWCPNSPSPPRSTPAKQATGTEKAQEPTWSSYQGTSTVRTSCGLNSSGCWLRSTDCTTTATGCCWLVCCWCCALFESVDCERIYTLCKQTSAPCFLLPRGNLRFDSKNSILITCGDRYGVDLWRVLALFLVVWWLENWISIQTIKGGI